MEILNRTRFLADRLVVPDAQGRDELVIVVKATFSGLATGQPLPAEEQRPIQKADEYWGDPGTSSLRAETDLAPFKPATDVALIGHAYAPRGRAAVGAVTLRVGKLAQSLGVFGDRRWERLGPSDPEPFEKMPLVYERAFGGRDLAGPDARRHEAEERNPVGRGFRARRSAAQARGTPLPNIEDPRQLLRDPDDRPEPVGFGFVARHWRPRRERAGTYDAAWEKTRAPLPPLDLDPRYHNAAHPRLLVPGYLRGDEPAEISGATPGSRIAFTLPGVRPRIHVTIGKQPVEWVETPLDTLVFFPDEDCFTLVWRGRRTLGPGEMVRLRRIEVEAE